MSRIGMAAAPVYAPPVLANLTVVLGDFVAVDCSEGFRLGRLTKIFWLPDGPQGPEPRGLVTLFSGGWISSSLTALRKATMV